MNVGKNELVSGLSKLGLKPGHTVLIHSSLSSFGHVDGGADTVIDAILDVISTDGTMIVPTLTGNETLSPSNPPKFDPRSTPCWTGRIPEIFRQRPEAVRSLHPTHSVAAMGRDATWITAEHINSITPCDEISPYGKLAQFDDGYILLIGVTHASSTMFHHVEELAGVDYHMQNEFSRCAITVGERTIHRHYLLHKYGMPRNFDIMEPVFMEQGVQTITQVGTATLRLIKARPLVELTLRCLRANAHILCATKL